MCILAQSGNVKCFNESLKIIISLFKDNYPTVSKLLPVLSLHGSRDKLFPRTIIKITMTAGKPNKQRPNLKKILLFAVVKNGIAFTLFRK